MASDLTARRMILLLLIATSVLLATVIRPIANSLIVASALATVLWPVRRKLARRLGNRRGPAAGLLVFGIVILMLGPLAAVSAFVVNEAARGLKFVSDTLRGARVAEWIERLPEPLRNNASEALKALPRAQAEAVSAGWAAVTATGQFAFHSVLMLIALFFLLVEGDEFVAWLDHSLPLKPGQTRELLAEFKTVSYGVVVSTFVTASVQSAVALVGYLVARVPYPMFFCALTLFCALIPAIGASGVCVLAALILLLTGHPVSAVFLAIWGVAVVGVVDNVIKPLILQGGMRISGALVFFAMLGGVAAFGMMGVLLGPLALSLFLALLRIYERDFGSREGDAPTPPD